MSCELWRSTRVLHTGRTDLTMTDAILSWSCTGRRKSAQKEAANTAGVMWRSYLPPQHKHQKRVSHTTTVDHPCRFTYIFHRMSSFTLHTQRRHHPHAPSGFPIHALGHALGQQQTRTQLQSTRKISEQGPTTRSRCRRQAARTGQAHLVGE